MATQPSAKEGLLPKIVMKMEALTELRDDMPPQKALEKIDAELPGLYVLIRARLLEKDALPSSGCDPEDDISPYDLSDPRHPAHRIFG